METNRCKICGSEWSPKFLSCPTPEYHRDTIEKKLRKALGYIQPNINGLGKNKSVNKAVDYIISII